MCLWMCLPRQARLVERGHMGSKERGIPACTPASTPAGPPFVSRPIASIAASCHCHVARQDQRARCCRHGPLLIIINFIIKCVVCLDSSVPWHVPCPQHTCAFIGRWPECKPGARACRGGAKGGAGDDACKWRCMWCAPGGTHGGRRQGHRKVAKHRHACGQHAWQHAICS